MTSVRNPVTYFLARMPENVSEFNILLEAWTKEIEDDVTRRDSTNHQAATAWARSYQALRCMTALLKRNDTFMFEFRGMTHDCVFSYHIEIETTRFDIHVRWRQRLRVNFVRVGPILSMSAQAASSVSSLEETVFPAFTDSEYCSGHILEEMYWNDFETVANFINEPNSVSLTSRIPIGDFTLDPNSCKIFSITRPGLTAHLYINEDHVDLCYAFSKFCMTAQLGIPVSMTHYADASSIREFEDMFARMFTNAKDSITSKAVIICSNITALYRTRHDPATCVCILTGLCATLDISTAMISSVSKACLTYLSAMPLLAPALAIMPNMMAQGAVLTLLPDIVPFVSIFCTIMSAYALDKIPGGNTIDAICKKLNNLGRGVQGGNTLFSFFATQAQVVIDVIYEGLFGIPRGSMELSKYVADIAAWTKEVQALSKWEVTDMVVIDADVCQRIDSCHSRGSSLMSQLTNLRVSSQQMAIFNHHFRVIQKVYDRILNLGKKKYKSRIEPIVVHFYGESGVGKSCLTRLFAQDILVEEEVFDSKIDSADVENEMYFRSTEQQFWDGYKGQMICVYDDWLQSRDSIANPNPELMELIRCCNVARYNLRMADLIEKARSEFRSRLIILTSNNYFPHVESVTTRAAVKRRRHVVARVHLAPEYANSEGMVDLAKVTGPSDINIYRFDIVDNIDDKKVIHSNINYDTFKAITTKMYREKRNINEDRVRLLQERAVKLRAARDGVNPVDVEELYGSCEELNNTGTDKIQFLQPVMSQQVVILDTSLVVQPPKHYVDLDSGMAVLEFVHAYNNIDPTLQARLRGVNDEQWRTLSRLSHNKSIEEFYELGIDWAIENGLDISRFILCADKKVELTIMDNIRNAITPRARLLSKYSDQLVTSLKEQLTKFWESPFSTKLKFLAQVFGVLASAASLYRIMSPAAEVVEPISKPELKVPRSPNTRRYPWESEASSGDPKTKTARRMRSQYIRESDSYALVQQAALDPNQKELISGPIYNNIFRVFIVTDKGERAIFNAFFVKGKCALIPVHALFCMRRAHRVWFRNAGWPKGYDVPGSYFEGLENVTMLYDKDGHPKDAAMICMPPAFPTMRDITSHFVKRSELGSYQSFPASIPLLTFSKGKYMHTIYTGVKAYVDKCANYTSTSANGKNEILTLRHSYVYQTDTDAGDCGAPLVVANTALQRKIVGFHVAGGGGVGCSTSLTSEDLSELLSTFLLTQQISLVIDDIVSDDCTTPEGGFIPIGKVGRNYAPPMKTALRESPLHGKLEPITTAPSRLRPFWKDEELIDPLALGLKKCGVSQEWVDPKLISAATRHFRPTIFENTDLSMCRVLTYEEGIQGTEHAFIDPINRRSSPGYPWVNLRTSGSVGKTEWLGDGDYILDDPVLRAAVDLRISKAKHAIRQPVYWIDTLKDERRTFDKVNVGKTRVFAAGAQDYILAFRMYFLAFNAHVMQNMISNEIAVGINPYSDQWHRLAKSLQVKGDKVVAGDFSNFDGTLNSQILMSILDMVNDWYDDGEENKLIRAVLWEDVVSSIHIYKDNLYQWTHSQPSGNPMTVIINSCYNSLSMRVVWLLLMADTEYSNLKHFTENVSMISYGDDNVLNISDNVIEFFNQQTISKGYETIGMKYTMEDKGEAHVTHRTLNEVNFLKRTFLYDHDALMHLGQLDMSVIMEMMNWVRGNTNIEESTCENIGVAVRELSLYPEKIYDARIAQIKRVCRTSLREQPFFPSWEEARLESKN